MEHVHTVARPLERASASGVDLYLGELLDLLRTSRRGESGGSSLVPETLSVRHADCGTRRL
jgi:hypothetical protein